MRAVALHPMRDPVASGPHWPPGRWEAAIAMLVVETIAKIRRAYFSPGKPIRIAASCTYRGRSATGAGRLTGHPGRPGRPCGSVRFRRRSCRRMPPQGRFRPTRPSDNRSGWCAAASAIDVECRWRGSLTRDGAFAGRQPCAAPIVSAITAPRRPRGLSGPTAESRGLVLRLRVELRAEQNRDRRDPHPHHHADGAPRDP